MDKYMMKQKFKRHAKNPYLVDSSGRAHNESTQRAHSEHTVPGRQLLNMACTHAVSSSNTTKIKRTIKLLAKHHGVNVTKLSA